MKLLLIKFGKAVHTIKRDGIRSGGKRVWGSFWAMFRRVKKGDILFITGGVGDSARYRTDHVAQELEQHGFQCAITIQDNPFLSSYVDKFKVFVFHRTLFSPSVEKMIQKIKDQSKIIIFDTDDLVFDKKYLKHMDFFKKMNSFERKLYENGVGGEIVKDPYVRVCTTTTGYLADKLKEEGKRVIIVTNKMPESDLEIVEEIEASNLAQRYFAKAEIVIGYFSGAHGHDKDFYTIQKVLVQLLDKHPSLRLFLAGPLEIGTEFDKYQSRIKRMAYVPRRENYRNIAGVDINLAPLEIGNPFCESKSELKFFEAGLLGVPTVATATRTFCEAISDGKDGFVAKDEIEWREKLEQLILSEELRKSMGKKAKEKALENYTVRNSQTEEYYQYLREVLQKEA
ncbi:MAG: glycosyltransferase [Candidatus Moranbacteria bacterium]|jgi:glycosyltransferase involved in cell wall biosynthesis|nr:glycosyltransferase [Candidatus Moranbacteria bacterium]